MNRGILTIAALLAVTSLAQAQLSASVDSAHETKGFVTIRPKQQLYVEYKPAAPGKPTVVLLNGLTYSVRNWDAFVAAFQDKDLGILRLDSQGQGETLLKAGVILAPISLDTQIDDLHALLQKLMPNQPVYLAGLSYGGGLALAHAAKYPGDVKALILMAPFTEPVKSQDDWIRLQITNTRVMYPYNPASDDDLYDYFLHILIETTYPTAEPSVLDNPYKLEAIFHMVQGIRKFHARTLLHQLPAGSVHLMQAGSDQYIQSSVFDEFWAKLPRDVAMSRIVIEGSEHKIPEAVPNFSAAWVEKILAGDSQLTGAAEFVGYPQRGRAESHQIVINLPKDK